VVGRKPSFELDFLPFVELSRGHLERRVDPEGVVSVTNPLGHRTQQEYDALNWLTKVVDPFGNLTTFGSDPNGNLLSVTDARNGLTEYAYNTMDRLETRTDPGRPPVCGE
jgi:YD repeat-containing protein